MQEPILEELFQYRFEEHQIEGHSLGNLLLAATYKYKKMTLVMQ
ncbi:2-phospho-L-lactate transferase CofD family protein [Streptococcus pneumoniae]